MCSSDLGRQEGRQAGRQSDRQISVSVCQQGAVYLCMSCSEAAGTVGLAAQFSCCRVSHDEEHLLDGALCMEQTNVRPMDVLLPEVPTNQAEGTRGQ